MACRATDIGQVVHTSMETCFRGEAHIVAMRTVDGWDATEMLRLAASLDQASGHVIARALVREARGRGLHLSTPSGVTEVGGTGIRGTVEGRDVLDRLSASAQ